MSKSIVFLGASGAVGAAALDTILRFSGINKLLLLGRRKLNLADSGNLDQQIIDISDPATYEAYITDFDTAICTLGVGEPSKISKADFVKIDKTAVLDFAKACKTNGVKHFQLLSSVGVNAASKSFFLRTKGELIEALEELKFDRLSIFQPSMILTPTNRYGLSQAIVLKVWPMLDFLLQGKAKKYRGIKVEELGKAIANNILTAGAGTEYLQYDQFKSLLSK
ncbi:NAD(P)H-binding protein [Labilibaculum antarcticum]|nr:NAD(P)H-binding protein [Labilibaculum antarcticum]